MDCFPKLLQKALLWATVNTCVNIQFDSLRFAVAEWSKVPASFFCVRSLDCTEFEPSHGAQRQATLAVDSGFEHRPQHP